MGQDIGKGFFLRKTLRSLKSKIFEEQTLQEKVLMRNSNSISLKIKFLKLEFHFSQIALKLFKKTHWGIFKIKPK